MQRYRSAIFAGLIIACIVAISSAWLASSHPDGLERVAENEEFLDQAEGPSFEILPDYTVPGIDGEVSTAIAGIIGVGLVAGLGFGAGYLLRARRTQQGT